MKLLRGKKLSEKILKELKAEISISETKPGLAVVLIGNDKASKIYVSLKEKAAKRIGMNFFKFQYGKSADEKEIIKKIETLNEDKKINGIIVQLPLPSGFNTQKIINQIAPGKDVDGFHPQSLKLFLEKKEIFWPVFPRAIISLLEFSGEKLEGKTAAVLAKSQKFGRVMEEALKRKKIQPKNFLLKNPQRKMDFLKNFDIVISACGYPKIIAGEMLKKGAIVIDGGITKKGKKILGDADLNSMKKVANFCSPVPGGVGPVTVATLLENVCEAFRAPEKKIS